MKVFFLSISTLQSLIRLFDCALDWVALEFKRCVPFKYRLMHKARPVWLFAHKGHFIFSGCARFSAHRAICVFYWNDTYVRLKICRLISMLFGKLNTKWVQNYVRLDWFGKKSIFDSAFQCREFRNRKRIKMKNARFGFNWMEMIYVIDLSTSENPSDEILLRLSLLHGLCHPCRASVSSKLPFPVIYTCRFARGRLISVAYPNLVFILQKGMQISSELPAWQMCPSMKTHTLVTAYFFFIEFLLKTLKYIIDVWSNHVYGWETIR